VTARLALLAALGAAVAAGQIQLFVRHTPGSERPAGQTLDFGSVATGDAREIPLRIRNLGEASVTLVRFRIRPSGSPFALDGHPSIPHVVAPGWNVDFRVRFRPSEFGNHSAVLEINELTFILVGYSPPTAILAVEDRGRFEPISAGDTVVFGRIERASRLSRRFRLTGPPEATVTVAALSLESGVFESSALPQAPLTLRSGEAAEFVITYAPVRAGIHQSVLRVDDRAFILEGVAYDPPLPKPEIRLEPETLESARQGKVRITLPSPAPASAMGELQIEFQPSVQPAGEDAAILFVNGKGRSIAFTIREGEAAGRFGAEEAAVFQTGTTAGTLAFTARLGAHTVRYSVQIPATPVVIDSAAGRRTARELELEVRGFDNSRSVREITFTFYDTQGRQLPGQPIRADVVQAFRSYFESSTVGGMFSLTARFPVSGDPSLVGAVEVEFASAPGPSVKRRIPF
jgi:hypothetical protein